MMKSVEVRKDVPYAPEHGFRGLADIVLPEASGELPLAIVIHGGGWNSMDKSALLPVAKVFAEAGFAVFSPNYRLLGDAPWPACLEDCLRAIRFAMAKADSLGLKLLDSPLTIAGASAGGHLAMMAGLSLPKGSVGHIVSMAGPSDIEELLLSPDRVIELPPSGFFGKEPSKEDWLSASPLSLFKPGCPPLACVQSVNDKLVPPLHSEKAVEKCREAGSEAELVLFEGNDAYHGFWQPGPQGQPASERLMIPVLDGIMRKLAAKLEKEARKAC